MNPHPLPQGVAPVSAERPDYDAVYRHRRERSTMADDARRWLTAAVERWSATQQSWSTGAPYRILSLGCGDGNLDLPVIDAARRHGPVHYVGCDITPASLEVFAAELELRPADSGLSTELLARSFTDSELLQSLGTFDLVLLSHVLYYVADPAAVVLEAVERHAALDGRVVVIQSAYRGVPSLTESALGSVPFVPAEEVAAQLAERGVIAPMVTLQGRLCIDEVRADSALGRELLHFLVERDAMSETETVAVRAAMDQVAERIDGSWWMPEDIGIIEIRPQLRRAQWDRAPDEIDPLHDYHVLAASFDWVNRLRGLAAPAGAPPRLLDVGCGTGRWLRVLAATHPQLCQSPSPRVQYDRVDPTAAALPANAEIASTMFDMGTTWVDFVERTQLPTDTYGLIWSVHSLYMVPVDALPGVLGHLAAALHPDGAIVVALAAREAFYITAQPALTGGAAFTSADDVVAAAVSLGLAVQTFDLDYVEAFDAADDEAIRRFVWHESIGNSYAPAGMWSDDLPPLPTGEWWDKHRHGDRYEFPQRVTVAVISRPPT